MLEFLPFIVLILVFWLFILRPARKRQSAMMEVQDSAQPGVEVVLTSGILGTIVERTDDHIVVEIADGVQIRALRGAIGQIVHPIEKSETPGDDTLGSEEN